MKNCYDQRYSKSQLFPSLVITPRNQKKWTNPMGSTHGKGGMIASLIKSGVIVTSVKFSNMHLRR